ncbi:MAG TPA: YlmH/Sll1252 family protein, partial [Tissierellaceae bacterium]
MIDKDLYINHINDDEKIIKMKQVLDKIEIVLKNHTVEYTDFLDPYEISLAVSILNRFQEISYIQTGGYETSERSILIIFPEYMYQGDIDLNLSFLEINGNISSLRHPDFLGAILNLGITRDKVGDILIDNDRAVVVARSEISDYLYYNLEKISNINVKINYINEINI